MMRTSTIFSWVRFLFTLSCIFYTINATSVQCPSRCLCFRTTVRCMFLKLEEVPEVPDDTTILDLRYNKIKEVTRNNFKNLKNLNTLLLNNNHIIRIQDDAFNGLHELRYLYLYKNRIKTIGSRAFKGLHKLKQLYIHFNKIEKLEPDTFADLPSLERLFLHNNRLSKIPYGAFKKLKSLQRLRLDSNALICDCEIMWLAEMLKENQGSTQATVTCDQPNTLQGKPLAALNPEDLRCKRPKLTEEPNDVDISFGGTAYFTCKADGDPKPEIIWLHNSNEILPDQDERHSILTDGTLMITEAQDLDEGVYECMAKSPAGEIKSRAAKMHYLKSKENKLKGILSFTEQPTDSTVPVGSTIILPCSAAGDSEPVIHWTQNGIALPQIFRYYVSSTGSLTIKNVQKSDAGVYQCIATTNESSIAVSARIVVEETCECIEE